MLKERVKALNFRLEAEDTSEERIFYWSDLLIVLAPVAVVAIFLFSTWP